MEKLPKITQGKFVKKGWGNELHIENNHDYCGKLLVFNKGKKFSMHYHVEKYETWYIQKGKLIFRWINPQNADIIEDKLKEGDIVGFTPNDEYEFVINNERLYRIMNKYITIKYEHEGNKETYNTSWAQGS